MAVLKFIHFTMWILAVVKKHIKSLCRPAFNSYDSSSIFDHTQTVVKKDIGSCAFEAFARQH